MIIKQTTLIAMTIAMTMLSSCGTMHKASSGTPPTPTSNTTTTPTVVTEQITSAQRLDDIAATMSQWHTMQAGGSMSVSSGRDLSSSMQVRMVRDQAIYISLRPVLGIEVARLLITADSVYAIDKYHKRYLAEKVTLLTAGVPITVGTVQDILLGRSFLIGQGTFTGAFKPQFTLSEQEGGYTLTANESYKGYNYAFGYQKANNHISSLDIVPAGSTTPIYQVQYGNVKQTVAGNIAHSLHADATADGQHFSLELNYNDIEWNREVKIDRSIPNGYKRMSASSLASLLGGN